MDEVMKHRGAVPVWLPENLGFIKAINIGLTLSVKKFGGVGNVALLNNDVEVTEGWLDRMSRSMERDQTVKAVGPVTGECKSWQSYENAGVSVPVFTPPEGFAEMDTEGRARSLADCYGELAGRCGMLAFFCTVFKREVFEKIGFLDEAFGVGLGDDDDFCKRMKSAGMRCFLSMGTYVFHNHRTTFRELYSEQEISDMQADRKKVYRDKHGEDAKV
jgi:GT2 family glycosyltransferase